MNNENITFKELDDLIGEIAKGEKEIEEFERKVKELRKPLIPMYIKVTEYLKSLNREDYISPHGKVKVILRENIRMPQTPELKDKLWAWMREKGIYDHYATVQANSLKALFMKERDAAVDRGEDMMTFALPGMEPATSFEDLDFKPTK